ncbi:TetR/AcrR family transcriptional regulator [Phytohabitans flavus]|uniref:TetR/AcrR family transcriptional regulator n=1 Tax=Phytohabitans flavus TaxID=1076124 RepID=UPI003633EA15
MARTKGFDPDVAVDQAMELFWANGYANTTPQQLVEALGIGRGSLYNAFTSKHNLYELALRRYHDRVTTRFIEVLDQPGPARERIRSALELIVTAVHEDQQRRGCMIANAAVEFAGTDEAVNRLVRRALHRQEAALRSAIEEGSAPARSTPTAMRHSSPRSCSRRSTASGSWPRPTRTRSD